MKPRILIADSDGTAAEELAKVLSGFDVLVEHAFDSDSADRSFLEFGPDVLFVDALLPKRGGFEFIKSLRRTAGGETVPIFVTSAFLNNDLRDVALRDCGAAGYLQKPLGKANVAAKLAEILFEGDKAPDQEASHSLWPEEISARGGFSRLELPQLIAGVVGRRLSCRIAFEEGRVRRLIYFREGSVSFAQSNLVSDTLGRLLLHSGAIGEAAYVRALETMKSTRRKMGEILLEQGDIGEAALNDAIRANIVEKIVDIFSWGEGQYQLLPFAEPPVTIPGESMDGKTILWEAVRSRYSQSDVARILEPYADRQRLVLSGSPSNLSAETGSPESETRAVLERCAAATVAEAMARSGEAHYSLLLFALLRGYLKVASNPGEAELEGDGSDRARRRLRWLKGRNAFQVLGAKLNASDEDVRNSYVQLAKASHPDTLGKGGSDALRLVFQETFALISDAYAKIDTESRRKEYLASLRRGGSSAPTEGQTVLNAEILFQEGEKAFSAGSWAAAIDYYTKSARLAPNEPDYFIRLGMSWMGGGVTQTKAREATKAFMRAHELAPHLATPLYQLGKLASASCQAGSAVRLLVRAHKRAPRDREIVREIQRLVRENPKESLPNVPAGLRPALQL